MAHNKYYNMRPWYIGDACELFNQFVRIWQDTESYKFEIRKRFLYVDLEQHAVIMNPMILMGLRSAWVCPQGYFHG